jgi:hypothetical protein
MARMAARYPGTCTACGGRIRVGDEIEYSRGKSRHAACVQHRAPAAPEPAAPAVRVELTGEYRVSLSAVGDPCRSSDYGRQFCYRLLEGEHAGEIRYGEITATGLRFGYAGIDADRHEVTNPEAWRDNAPAIRARLDAEIAARVAEAQRVRAQAEADVREGRANIGLVYHDGEYYSAWEVRCDTPEQTAIARRLLTEIGVCKYLSGWGWPVADGVREALGERFTYPQAVEYARPAREAAESTRRAQSDLRAARIAEARATGQPVPLRSWSEPCCERGRLDCDVDNLTEYAMPDGTTRVERIHTY